MDIDDNQQQLLHRVTPGPMFQHKFNAMRHSKPATIRWEFHNANHKNATAKPFDIDRWTNKMQNTYRNEI